MDQRLEYQSTDGNHSIRAWNAPASNPVRINTRHMPTHEIFADYTHLHSYLQNNQLLSPFPDFLLTMPGIGMVDLRNNYFVRVPAHFSVSIRNDPT